MPLPGTNTPWKRADWEPSFSTASTFVARSVLQREVQPLENHLVDVFLPRVPHVDEFADQRHAGGRQLGLAQQWNVSGFQQCHG